MQPFSTNKSVIDERASTYNILYGLPLEIWRFIFSKLDVKDLCRCCLVCQDWNSLVCSLDSTRWKWLYLEQRTTKRWKHPNWPHDTNVKVEFTWKDLYRQRYNLSRLWLKSQHENVTCSTYFFLRKNRQRKTLHVGAQKPFHTLRSAVEHASSYTRIIVHPGVYQDTSTLHLKSPVEIIGSDDPSKIVLMMQIEVRVDSAKLENLTIKPMHFNDYRRRRLSTTVVRVLHGHLFIYNCAFNGGGILVASTGLTTISACSFHASFVNLKGIKYSSISSCLFTGSKMAVFVMKEPIFQFVVRPDLIPEHVGGWVDASDERKFEKYYRSIVKGGLKRNTQQKLETQVNSNEQMKDHKLESITKESIPCIKSMHLDEKGGEILSKWEERSVDLSNSGNDKMSSSTKPTASTQTDNAGDISIDSEVKQLLRLSQGVIIRNVKICDGKGGITIRQMGQAWIENSTFHDLFYAVRILHNSRGILLNNKIHSCETTAIYVRQHSCAFIAGNQIFANGEAGIDIRSSADPIIQHNEIHSGHRSGIVCLGGGKGMIRDNDIYNNKEAGIYILNHGSPKVKSNYIWSGRAAGIAVTEDGRGHITNNVISGMEWAGLDIRQGGNPVVSHNIIKNGHSDGIVIGEKGKSVILDNTIIDNCGCGIWILDGSHPLIHSNRITGSGSHGIAFFSKSDPEHSRQRMDSQFSTGRRQQNNNDDNDLIDESSLTDEDIPMIPARLPEIEPESRFVHVSKPEKELPQIEANLIADNGGNGIIYDGQEGIVISKNIIQRSLKNGISLKRSIEITVDDNTVRDNLMTGIHIETGVCCSVMGNGVYDNKEYGIFCGGLGIIRGNDVLSHQLPSLFVRSIANISVLLNRFHSWQNECIYVDKDSRVSIEGNEFFLTSVTKRAIAVHPNSDAEYKPNENLSRKIFLESDQNGLESKIKDQTPDQISVIDLCAGCKDMGLSIDTLKPHVGEQESEETAPFFTSVELSRTKNKSRQRRSAFCSLL